MNQYLIGQKFEIKKCFSTEEVKLFASLTGDNNPIHINDDEAITNGFPEKIVHGILAASVFSAIIANKLPGPGSIYLSQNLNFKSPIFHNQKVIFTVEITKIREDKPIFELETKCENNKGELIIIGNAIIYKK